MSKFLYILLFLFPSVLSAQSIKHYIQDSISKENDRKKVELLNKRLLFEFQNVDFDGLSKKIISDIDFNQLKSENLVIYFRNICNERRGVIMYGEDICSANDINPAYNQFYFWNKKNIKFIQKKYHKNVIPYLQITDTFITDGEEFENQVESFYFRESKKIIDFAKTQEKKGKVVYKFSNKSTAYQLITEKELDIYYFPYKNKNADLEIINDTNTNFDSLYLHFVNSTGRIVTVKFDYQKDNNELYKSYHYKNKIWVEIPTKEEYRFRF